MAEIQTGKRTDTKIPSQSKRRARYSRTRMAVENIDVVEAFTNILTRTHDPDNKGLEKRVAERVADEIKKKSLLNPTQVESLISERVKSGRLYSASDVEELIQQRIKQGQLFTEKELQEKVAARVEKRQDTDAREHRGDKKTTRMMKRMQRTKALTPMHG